MGQSGGQGGGGGGGFQEPGMMILQGLFGPKARPKPVQMPPTQTPGIAAPVGPSNVGQQPLPAEQYLAQLQQTMGSMRGF